MEVEGAKKSVSWSISCSVQKMEMLATEENARDSQQIRVVDTPRGKVGRR